MEVMDYFGNYPDPDLTKFEYIFKKLQKFILIVDKSCNCKGKRKKNNVNFYPTITSKKSQIILNVLKYVKVQKLICRQKQ